MVPFWFVWEPPFQPKVHHFRIGWPSIGTKPSFVMVKHQNLAWLNTMKSPLNQIFRWIPFESNIKHPLLNPPGESLVKSVKLQDPAAIKWGESGAEYVCESTGVGVVTSQSSCWTLDSLQSSGKFRGKKRPTHNFFRGWLPFSRAPMFFRNRCVFPVVIQGFSCSHFGDIFWWLSDL